MLSFSLCISMDKQMLSFFFIIYFIIPLVGLIKRRHQAQKRNWRTSLTFANIVILLHWLLVSVDVSRGPWLPTWGCCTASLGTSLHSRSSASRRSRTTTQTSGHVGASDPRRPFSRTGPDDTTGKKNAHHKMKKKEKERQSGEERCTQAYKSVTDVQLFQRTPPFIFMMTECQRVEEAWEELSLNCCHEQKEAEKEEEAGG